LSVAALEAESIAAKQAVAMEATTGNLADMSAFILDARLARGGPTFVDPAGRPVQADGALPRIGAIGRGASPGSSVRR
jgi:hypothetical protein